MFVRSQDRKTLVPIEKFIVCVSIKEPSNILCYENISDDYAYIVLGKYLNEFRAIKVLSDICDWIQENQGGWLNDNMEWKKDYKRMIYQMPND